MIPISKPTFGEEEETAVLEVLRSGQLAQGKKIEQFEKDFANYIGTAQAVAVSSGTAALELAIAAFDFPKDSEIITTPFTFASTANAIVNNNCKPVFVDIDPKTFNIDPKNIEKAITEKTKAILPVHLFGQCADMEKIAQLSKKYNLIVIEDAAQAHGAEHHGKKAGVLGDAGCFSFYATKNMATGEGGIVTTNNSKVAEKARMLRHHGQVEKYKLDLIGRNYRMTELQAALGIVQLRKLNNMNHRRIEIAEIYDSALNSKYIVPYKEPFNKHVYHQYSLKVEERDNLKKKLEEDGIQTGIYYPIPVHLQKPYIQKFGFKENDFPIAEKVSKEILSLPIYPRLTDEEQKEVINALVNFL